jgi:hypothetical protein
MMWLRNIQYYWRVTLLFVGSAAVVALRPIADRKPLGGWSSARPPFTLLGRGLRKLRQLESYRYLISRLRLQVFYL